MFEREKAGYLTKLSQEELSKVVLFDGEAHSIKELAISYLNAGESCKIFWKLSDKWLRFQILKKDLPQEFLAEVCCSSSENEIVEEAINGLNDQKLLMQSVFKTKACYKTMLVSKIFNQLYLAKIALKERFSLARVEAIKKCRYQYVLKQAVFNDTDYLVREIAATQIRNQAVLEEVALYDPELRVRKAAAKKVKNKVVLNRICLDPLESSLVKSAIIDKVDSQEVLEDVARDSKLCIDLRVSAIRRLKNQEVLKKIVLNNSDPSLVKMAAIKCISDQEVLANIAKSDNSEEVRAIVAKKLENHDVIEMLALEGQTRYEGYERRASCISKITSQDVLEKVALNDKYAVLRMAALKKLLSETVIATIAISDEESFVRRKALDMMSNQELIQSVAYILENSDECVILLKKTQSRQLVKEICENTVNWFVREVCKELLQKWIEK